MWWDKTTGGRLRTHHGLGEREPQGAQGTQRKRKKRCVEEFVPIHQAQLLSYLKATGLRLGLLLNFKTQVLRDGIQRMVR
ncbi:MAG: GxxExxY protein [Thermoguttaceae bacterium]